MKAIDYILLDSMYGDGGDTGLGGLPVDITSIDEGDVLVCKDGLWQGMSVAEIVGNPELVKGEDGFTPVPIFRTADGAIYLKFKIGLDAYKEPIYGEEVELISVPRTTKSINVVGVNSGSYSDGNVIPSGTKIEDIIEKMLKKVIPPTYTSPSLSLSGSSPFVVEAGTVNTITIVPTFIQNNAGNVTSCKIYKNGNLVKTTSVIENFVDTNVGMTDSNIVYKVEVSYATGAVLKNNVGEDYATGQIQAGTISSSNLTYTSYRKTFYGTNSSTGAVTSNEIRALSGSSNSALTAGSSFTLSIPVGAKKVIFAYPANLRDISSVQYVEGMNAEIKGVFGTPEIVTVYGANSYNAISYKVYTYTPAEAFNATANYKITI